MLVHPDLCVTPAGTRNRVVDVVVLPPPPFPLPPCPTPSLSVTLDPHRHGNFDGGRWSIIKVAHRVPSLWEIRGRGTCQNAARRSYGTRVRNGVIRSLPFNSARGYGNPVTGGTATPLKYSDYATGDTVLARYTASLTSALEKEKQRKGGGERTDHSYPASDPSIVRDVR